MDTQISETSGHLLVRDAGKEKFDEGIDRIFCDIIVGIKPEISESDFYDILVDSLVTEVGNRVFGEVHSNPDLRSAMETGYTTDYTFDFDGFGRSVASSANEFVAVFENAGKEVSSDALVGHLKGVFREGANKFFQWTCPDLMAPVEETLD